MMVDKTYNGYGPFARDRNIGPHEMARLLVQRWTGEENVPANERLLVSSTFYTIQGEGPFAGQAAFFIRLAGCNRGIKSGGAFCEGCDASFEIAQATPMSIQHVLDLLLQEEINIGHSIPLVVITGGEPLIHPTLDRLITAFLELNTVGHVQIETNGDWDAPKIPSRLADRLVYVMSPKPSPSRKYVFKPINQDMLEQIDAIKFLVSADEGSMFHHLPQNHIDQVLAHNESVRLKRNETGLEYKSITMYVSPIAVYARPFAHDEVASLWTPGLIDVPRTAANYAHAAKLVMRNPQMRLSTQTHLTLTLP